MNAKRSASLPSAFESARGDLICQDASRVAQEISAAIKRTIPPAIRYRWLDKLFEVRANGLTLLEFLQEPPGSLRWPISRALAGGRGTAGVGKWSVCGAGVILRV